MHWIVLKRHIAISEPNIERLETSLRGKRNGNKPSGCYKNCRLTVSCDIRWHRSYRRDVNGDNRSYVDIAIFAHSNSRSNSHSNITKSGTPHVEQSVKKKNSALVNKIFMSGPLQNMSLRFIFQYHENYRLFNVETLCMNWDFMSSRRCCWIFRCFSYSSIIKITDYSM